MALKVLMLRKKINDAKKALEALRAKEAEFETREKDLEKSIEEAATDEERSAVEEEVTNFETEKAAHDEEKGKLERQIEDLEKDLEAEEKAQNTDPEENEEREEEMKNKEVRGKEGFTIREAVQNERVKEYLAEVRSAMKEKRAITNVGLTIPDVMIGLLKEKIEGYSKLYNYVNVEKVSGDGRQLIMGSVPEAIWTEACAALNELNLVFNDVEVNCWKVGGFFAICNANLEDSDVDLAEEIISALGQAIGLAIDKAILYGTGTRMPLGIMTRLVQTAAPDDYPATARPWVDLHTSNIKSHAASVKGVDLFREIVMDSGAAKGKYAVGGKVWVMNETTHTTLQAQTLSTDANGNIVSGVADQMPVIGGKIVELNFIPDNVIIGGYFELYLLAERAGKKFATSEHVRFIQDQTVMKGTARYDGVPAIAEGFVAIGINGTTPNAAMTFAPDTANPGE